MEKLIVNGGTRLEGTVPVSGSKNAVLPIAVAAAILSDSASAPPQRSKLNRCHDITRRVRGARCIDKTKRFHALY